MSGTGEGQGENSGKTVTACVLLIGDEILSGRTKDSNLSYIAQHLNRIGVQVREARVIPDIEEEIVATVNEVRAKYDYVFTTGGIGPTHDDITADSVAKAFGVSIGPDPEAMALLQAHYAETGGEFTSARQRMARLPDGARMIANPLSKAPGFRIGNVFVMAGVPMVMHVMLDSLLGQLEGGASMLSRTLTAAIGEGSIAETLGEIQSRHADVSIGSYPYYRGREFGTSIVMRSVDSAALERAEADVAQMFEKLGVSAVAGEKS
ncbi:molybdenum cofactor synthesis domain-containing protein [Parvibaculum indicum]|uniref:competence/damage-inducible protein A n=1 Tax=Parvibaculum indicum TaxID=562969 RepID=UPI001421D53D|nr:molybdopterin-binding protein [Parvibaculum indicum]NIJ41196.1 molybdenum cofactor synthesis domain-containing protein [Parvibaculum indicum]